MNVVSARRRGAAVAAGLLALNLLVFWQVTGHGWVSYDTAQYVYENPVVRRGLSSDAVAWAFDPRHAYAANWHPLTWLSHLVDCTLFGLDRPGAHLAINLALHVVNTWLVFFVFWGMTRGAPRAGPAASETSMSDSPLWQSAVVAALFAVHPLHVESVAWLAERKDVLSTFFWLLTMAAYAWYAARPAWTRMAVVGAALALGLMSKPMLVTLPFVLLLLDVWPLGRAKFELTAQSLATWRRLVWEKSLLFALVLASSAMTFVVQSQGGAVNASQSLLERLAAGVWAYGMYLVKMAWPLNLACFYPHAATLGRSKYHIELALMGVLLLAITALAYAQRRQRPYLLVGWLWYVGTLVPVSGVFVQVGEQSMADRYTYVPLIGVFVMIAWGVPSLCATRKHGSAAVAIAATAMVGVLAALSWQQARSWQNSETLFRHAARVTRSNAFAHTSLGLELRRQGRLAEAAVECELAVAIDPDDWNNQQNLALILTDLNQLERAESHARRAARLNPHDGAPHAALGAIHARREQHEQAVEEFETAVRLDPAPLAPRLLLAKSLEALGRLPDAIDACRRAIELEPDDPRAYAILAAALAAGGDRQAAHAELSKAIALDPASSGYRVAAGQLLASLGNDARAAAEARKALELEPDNLEAALLEAELLMRAGHTAQAIQRYRHVVGKAPTHRAAVNNLAWLLAAQGNRVSDKSDAVALAEQITSAVPNDPDLLDTLAFAYAAAGRFDDALRTADQAIELATRAGNAPLVQGLSERRQAYRARKLPQLD